MTAVALRPADWRDRAACRDEGAELFFPVATGGSSAAQEARALAVCRSCPVAVPCLRFAVETREAGVWGGTTEAERNASLPSLTRGAA